MILHEGDNRSKAELNETVGKDEKSSWLSFHLNTCQWLKQLLSKVPLDHCFHKTVFFKKVSFILKCFAIKQEHDEFMVTQLCDDHIRFPDSYAVLTRFLSISIED